MLQNAYLLAKIGADTAENEQHFAEILPKIGNYPTGRGRRRAGAQREVAGERGLGAPLHEEGALQRHLGGKVSDAALAAAQDRWPIETPQTKEEYYYREVFESHYPGCAHVPTVWDGGSRSGGAEWDSAIYTREGLADTSRLTHALQTEGAVVA